MEPERRQEALHVPAARRPRLARRYAVTAADCVASIRRWAAVDAGGQAIMERVKDISKKDDKTFVIALKERFGPLLDQLAKPITRDCFIMREKDARKPPTEQVSENIGSGPFVWNRRGQARRQSRYDKNPKYMSRSEPSSGLAGGQVVKVERVIWENIADQRPRWRRCNPARSTSTKPLHRSAGTVQMRPQHQGRGVRQGRQHRHHAHELPAQPFSEVKARQALLYLINQQLHEGDVRRPEILRPLDSIFGSNTPIERRKHRLVPPRRRSRQGAAVVQGVRV